MPIPAELLTQLQRFAVLTEMHKVQAEIEGFLGRQHAQRTCL